MALSQPIRLNESRIGTVYLESDLKEFYSRAALLGAPVLLLILVSLVAAYFSADQLARGIVEPLVELARFGFSACRSKDHSIRVPRKSHDEIGLLCDVFNEIMNQNQGREASFQKTLDDLEVRGNRRAVALRKEIAERKQAEMALAERTSFLNSLIENAPLAVVAINADHTVQMCNPAFEKLFRYRREEILGRPLYELLGLPEIR
ncbi:MAG: PAS domain-containing protein, partial [Candidatus Acidiferrales bacterium]